MLSSDHMGETTDPTSSSGEALSRQPSESAISTVDEDEDELNKIHLGPKCSIREHLEKDKV